MAGVVRGNVAPAADAAAPAKDGERRPDVDDPAITAPEMSETTASSQVSMTSSSSAADERERSLGERTGGGADSDCFFGSSQQQTLALTQLARQLEYYFSAHNLSKDTYLVTLRKLNDGCVPVSILANFSKVRSIVPSQDDEVRVHAILQASAEYSDSLTVSSIDTATGKITTDDTPSSATTILAVGPVDNEPLQLSVETMKKTMSMNSLGSIVPSSPGTPSATSSAANKTSNTVIFRELAPDVTEDEVRKLFDFDGCPTIESIYADVAYCWYVCH